MKSEAKQPISAREVLKFLLYHQERDSKPENHYSRFSYLENRIPQKPQRPKKLEAKQSKSKFLIDYLALKIEALDT